MICTDITWKSNHQFVVIRVLEDGTYETCRQHRTARAAIDDLLMRAPIWRYRIWSRSSAAEQDVAAQLAPLLAMARRVVPAPVSALFSYEIFLGG